MEHIKRAIVTEYWLKKLLRELPKMSLPIAPHGKVENTLEPAVQTFKLDLPQTLTEKLFKISKNSDIALFILFMSGINMVLSRYAGSDDVVVGTLPPAADGDNRSVIFCRTQISQRSTIKEYITQTKDEVLEAIKFNGFSLDEMVEVLRAKNKTDSREILNTAVLYEPFQVRSKSIDRFNLIFTLTKQNNQLAVHIEALSLSNSELLANLKLNVISTLDRMLADTSLELSMLDILSPAEKSLLLYDFNNTEAEYPKDRTIYRLFAEQVKRTPNQIAVVAPIERTTHRESSTGKEVSVLHSIHISYRELYEKSDGLAILLQERGVEPNIIVGLMVERSLEMIVGIFGILKAGGAYLPIDPHYPQERIDFMLIDSGTNILLTRSVPVGEGEKVRRWKGEKILLDKIPNSPKCSTHDLPFLPPNLQIPSNPAYIIYTSGSTGKPKGVLVENGSAVNLLFALQREYPFSPADTYLLKTSYVFDVSVTELYGWFMGGGRLAILQEGGHKEPPTILDAIERHGVTHINFVPSMFSAFVDYVTGGNKNRLSGLKYIFLAGEALLPELATKAGDLMTATAARLENIYGPTEGTVYASKYSLSTWKGTGNIPIGKPLQNIKLYILDPHNNLQPIGIAGELCIGGAGLARGYLNRPQLTSERFITFFTGINESHEYKNTLAQAIRPSIHQTLITLYKTGDLARWGTEGNVEFLGRIDQQVKIRGFRVEPGEIENQLLKHKDVKEAIVLVKEVGTRSDTDPVNLDSPQETAKHLSAYIVSEQMLSIAELRGFLLKELPEYMIPSTFVRVDHIPLNANGKVDRKALESAGKGTALPTGVEFSAPRDHIEKTIANFWKELLNLDEVGIDDNFFDLGGTSLDIYKLNSKYKEVFNEDEIVLKMFRYPTIRTFSQYLSKKEAKEDDVDKLESRSVPVDRVRNSRTYQREKRKGSKYVENR